MKKMLIIVPSLGIGGQERIAVNTADCTQDVFDTELVVFQNKEKEYLTNRPIRNLDRPASDSTIHRILTQIQRIHLLRKVRNSEAPAVAFSLGMTANISNTASGIFSTGKTVVSIHGFAEIKKDYIHSFVFRHCNQIVCISKEMQERLLQLYPKLKKTIVIENGYDLREAELARRQRTTRADRPARLIAMGRLDPVKRYDLLLRAFRLVCDRYPTTTLSFMGTGTEEAALRKLARELSLEDQVSFLGYRESPYAILAEHDIFLMTSQTEGFPNSLIEAMACGDAIVSVDCLTGPKEIMSESFDPAPIRGIKYERYGVLVENLADEAELEQLFAEAVVSLIGNKKELLQYQEIGAVRAKEFSLEKYKEKLTSLFASLS